MPVCLHCGELANEGALFCTKCGFTLPQVESTASGGANLPPLPGAPTGQPIGMALPATLPPPPPPSRPPGGTAPLPYAPGGYTVLAPPAPGAVGPMPPPATGKYCIRCRTVISRVAVYCPVCQQPQS